jgi:hypothetical protein
MSDGNEENPESGAGVGGSDLATGPRTHNATRQDRPTPPLAEQASSVGELNNPNPSSGEEDFGDTRADGSPIGRELATSKNSVSEEDPAERA